MCGICGIIAPAAKTKKSYNIVQKMMTTLSHRGPDGYGIVQGENYCFGHRRLAVIDPEHAVQPMTSEDGSIILVYNGEIYNYIELRQELTRNGYKFKTLSDVEVLLISYQAYGIDCLSKLSGMFSFTLFDRNSNNFFCARDHFGIKPFYYAMLPDGGFIFASEIKALLKHPQVKAACDQKGFNQYLTFQFCLDNQTLFKDIFKLLPAHYVFLNAADLNNKTIIHSKPYWQLSYSIDTHHTEEYFIDTLQFLLQNSINKQMRSDVPLGGYLSGGLDSSSVVAMAASQYGRGFECFTGKFSEGRDYDESKFAKIVTQKFGCLYNEVIPSSSDFIELLPKLIYYMDEPAAGPGLFPQYLVSKMAKEKVTVVLGGQGGDEIFGGYARYMVAYLEQCLKGAIFETQEEGQHIVALDSIIKNLPMLKQYVPMLKSFWQKGLFEHMDVRYFRLVDRSPNLKSILHQDLWGLYDPEEIFSHFQKIFNHPETHSYLNKMTNFDQQTLLPALLQVEDRVSMAVSLESRVPMLDHKIAELLASMPPAMKFKNGQTKYALHKAMQSIVPEKVLARKDKMGFPVPLKEWWNGPLKEFITETLLSKRCLQRGFFDKKGLQHLIQSEGAYGRQIWGALCLEIWAETFLDG